MTVEFWPREEGDNRYKNRYRGRGDAYWMGPDIFDTEVAVNCMLRNEACFVGTGGMKPDPASICVNCNDVFAWGCADAERQA